VSRRCCGQQWQDDGEIRSLATAAGLTTGASPPPPPPTAISYAQLESRYIKKVTSTSTSMSMSGDGMGLASASIPARPRRHADRRWWRMVRCSPPQIARELGRPGRQSGFGNVCSAFTAYATRGAIKASRRCEFGCQKPIVGDKRLRLQDWLTVQRARGVRSGERAMTGPGSQRAGGAQLGFPSAGYAGPA